MDDTALQAAQPRDKPYKIHPGRRGVYLIVTPKGAKYWRYDLRRRGMHTTLSLGVFPETSLEDALAERDRIHAMAVMGIHPSVARRAARQGATLGCAGAAFALALSPDGELSVTVGEHILHLTRPQTDAIRSVLLACRS
ncbi:DUF4102 domain-containing protein [Luteimonas marina]|uniref:DUF4102 domain-containing protein n=1 Tax=Luteimonas marina TaxID=488485 RepID=A0A5C5U1U0_9GAMM|nr:Arm DNA-binding domain-containing protein [Luteimonas marina]TWT20331.1 DUF4102 domain-containing protein [Luteimonas marina]